MSTTAPDPAVKTYRGRTLEELLPKIREELGADAVVLRQREGLVGGVGGFFAQRCVEVEARRGTPAVDLYDEDEDALPPMLARMSADAQLAGFVAEGPAPVRTGVAVVPAAAPDDFVRRLEEAAAAWSDEPAAPAADAPEAEPEPPAELEPAFAVVPLDADEPAPMAPASAPVVSVADAPAAPPKWPRRPRLPARIAKAGVPDRVAQSTTIEHAAPRDEVAALTDELTGRGASPAWVARLIAEAGAHHAPLAADRTLRTAVRSVVARGLAAPPALPGRGAVVALVGTGGSGRTRLAASLAAAYGCGSTLTPAAVALAASDRGRELGALLKPHGVAVRAPQSDAAAEKAVEKAREGGFVVLDPPSLAPGDPAGIAALAGRLGPLRPDAVVVTVPATLGLGTALRLLAAAAPLGPTGIAITHADETDQLAVALEAAWSSGLPIVWMHAGAEPVGSLSAPDPRELAEALL